MKLEDIEKAVDNMLEPYDLVINRTELSKILDCTYVYVPQKVKDMGIPTMSNVGNLKVAKPILRQFLISQFSGAQIFEESSTEVKDTDTVEEETNEENNDN